MAGKLDHSSREPRSPDNLFHVSITENKALLLLPFELNKWEQTIIHHLRVTRNEQSLSSWQPTEEGDLVSI